MKLEHFGMAEPGDCRLVFTADAEELERAITAEQAAPDAPQAEEDLLTAAVNRTILEGFSALYEQIAAEYGVTPVTDPDFELLAVNRAEGFRAGAQFYALPPLTLGRYTGFVQAVEPHLIRQLTIEMEINRHHGDEERAADAAGKAALRQQVARELYAQHPVQLPHAGRKPDLVSGTDIHDGYRLYRSGRRRLSSGLHRLIRLLHDTVPCAAGRAASGPLGGLVAALGAVKNGLCFHAFAPSV